MIMPALFTCQLACSSRRAVSCLLLGAGCVLTTVTAYGTQVVLSECGCLAGMLALVVYGARAQHASRYPQAFGAVLVASLAGLAAAGFAGSIATATLLAVVEASRICVFAGNGCLQPDDGVLAGLDLAGAGLMAACAAFYAGRMAWALWQFGPIAAATYQDRPAANDAAPSMPVSGGPATGRANL